MSSKEKVSLGLDNYPSLKNLYENDRRGFGELIKGMMQIADQAVKKGWHKESKEAFSLSVSDVLKSMMEAVYEYDGMVSHHHSGTEQEALRLLGHENNPLSVLFGEATPRQADGEKITLSEFAGMEPIQLKQWFQELMYAARYVSHKDLAQYLLLGRFDLVEMEKAGHIRKLLASQPALQFQKDKGIPLGKRLKGTGFFDLGDEATKYFDRCPACDGEWNIDRENYAFCPDCRGAAYK